MQVEVETYTGHGGVEMLRRFRLDGREIEVSDNLDRWYGRDYTYFKVKGDDGNLYVLRLEESRSVWKLIMFQSERSQAASEYAHSSNHSDDGP
jgi:hypothetical protein